MTAVREALAVHEPASRFKARWIVDGHHAWPPLGAGTPGGVELFSDLRKRRPTRAHPLEALHEGRRDRRRPTKPHALRTFRSYVRWEDYRAWIDRSEERRVGKECRL